MIGADDLLRVKHVCMLRWRTDLHWTKAITLTDLIVLRDVLRDARSDAAQRLVVFLTIPKGVLFESPPVLEMFAERIAVLLAEECRNIFVVVEDTTLRRQTDTCIVSGCESFVRAGRVLVLDSLDEAFRGARSLAHREVLEVQRIVNRQSKPPASDWLGWAQAGDRI